MVQIFAVYTETDPTGELAEEVSIHIGADGIKVVSTGFTAKTLGPFVLEDVSQVKASAPSADPTDMEMFSFVVAEGSFVFEADDAGAIEQCYASFLGAKGQEAPNFIDSAQVQSGDGSAMMDVFVRIDPTGRLPAEELGIYCCSSGVAIILSEKELPEGWEKLTTDDGKVYYANRHTNATAWEPPQESNGSTPKGIKVLLSFSWTKISSIQASKPDDPDATESFLFEVSGLGGFEFECDDAEVLRSEFSKWHDCQRPTLGSDGGVIANNSLLLPAGWVERKDPGTGKSYYWNTALNITTWERPVAATEEQGSKSGVDVEAPDGGVDEKAADGEESPAGAAKASDEALTALAAEDGAEQAKEQARKEAEEEQARKEAEEEQARKEAEEEQARKEAEEEQARKEAEEEQARKEVEEEQARKEAEEEQARKEAEENARREAEERAEEVSEAEQAENAEEAAVVDELEVEQVEEAEEAAVDEVEQEAGEAVGYEAEQAGQAGQAEQASPARRSRAQLLSSNAENEANQAENTEEVVVNEAKSSVAEAPAAAATVTSTSKAEQNDQKGKNKPGGCFGCGHSIKSKGTVCTNCSKNSNTSCKGCAKKFYSGSGSTKYCYMCRTACNTKCEKCKSKFHSAEDPVGTICGKCPKTSSGNKTCTKCSIKFYSASGSSEMCVDCRKPDKNAKKPKEEKEEKKPKEKKKGKERKKSRGEDEEDEKVVEGGKTDKEAAEEKKKEEKKKKKEEKEKKKKEEKGKKEGGEEDKDVGDSTFTCHFMPDMPSTGSGPSAELQIARAAKARAHMEKEYLRCDILAQQTVYTRKNFLDHSGLPLKFFVTLFFKGDASQQLPISAKICDSFYDDSGVEQYRVLVKSGSEEKTKDEPVSAFVTFQANLQREDKLVLDTYFPEAKDKKKDEKNVARRLNIFQTWLDNAIKMAKKEKISPEGVGSLITFLHRDNSASATNDPKQAKKDAQLAEGIHKLEKKQLKITADMLELLRKAHRLCQEDLVAKKSEMPTDRMEIPAESGNIYMNKEPTISLKPIRKKLKSLNKDAMKALDAKNKATYHARKKSAAMQEQADMNDSRMDHSCSVCFSSFKDKQKLRLTPCGHAFHDKCLEPWLCSGKNHCPGCKLELLHTSKDDPD
jgi:hypothetical protein